MKSILAFLALAIASTSADSVCQNGVYALAAPLKGYPPAQQFCTKNFPPSTVTVNAAVKAKRATPTTTKTTTKTTTPVTTKATTKTTTTTTTKPPSTTKTTTTTTKPSTTTTDAKAALWTSLSSKYGNVLSTLCSCIEDHPTVTKSTTTTTPTTTTTTTTTTPTTTTTTTTTTVDPRITPATCPGNGDIAGCLSSPPNSGNCGCKVRYPPGNGGYCVDVTSCGPPCNVDIDCPDDEVCVEDDCNPGGGTCFRGSECLAYPPSRLFRREESRSNFGRGY